MQLETPRAVIKALGGTTQVAAKFGVKYRTAWTWNRKIPAKYADAIRDELAKLGKSAPKSVLGQN